MNNRYDFYVRLWNDLDSCSTLMNGMTSLDTVTWWNGDFTTVAGTLIENNLISLIDILINLSRESDDLEVEVLSLTNYYASVTLSFIEGGKLNTLVYPTTDKDEFLYVIDEFCGDIEEMKPFKLWAVDRAAVVW